MAVQKPIFSVVIPTFNGARFIGETLDSVLAQARSDVEVIVVDDGSTDDTADLVAEHAMGARLLRQDHLGVAVARNRGLAEATGRWVTFLDQDDLWHPDRLTRFLAWHERHPEHRLVATTEIAFSTRDDLSTLHDGDPLVGGWASFVAPEDGTYDDLRARADVAGSNESTTHTHLDMLAGPVTVTTSFFADPEVLRLAGGFAPHALAMDDYWLLVNAARISPLVRIDQPTVFYRVHSHATSRTTRLALPFLSSAVALRLGGGLVGRDDAWDDMRVGPLHHHLLDEVLGAGEDPRSRTAARHLSAVLLGHGVAPRLARAELKRRAPRLAGAVRGVRGRIRRGAPA